MRRKRISGNNRRMRSGSGGLFPCLTLVVLFVLSGCALASREDFVEGLPSESERDVSDYDLQHYVPVPEVGAKVVTSLERPDLELKVQWKNENGEDIDPPRPFLNGAVYQAEITLTAKGPYVFNPDTPFKYISAAVNGEPTGNNTDKRNRTLLVSYLPCGIKGGSGLVVNYDLQRYVPVPASGARVVTSLERADLKLEV